VVKKGLAARVPYGKVAELCLWGLKRACASRFGFWTRGWGVGEGGVMDEFVCFSRFSGEAQGLFKFSGGSIDL